MKIKQKGLQFPCAFPLKVMGLNTEEFSSAVETIVRKHLPSQQFTCTRQPSSGEKYVSLTITFRAESREQLNALYEELHAHNLVLMTL